MYILSEMKQVNDSYSVEEVNCLEKPLGVMLNSFNPLYRNFYLLFEKMMQSYNFEYYKDIGFDRMITMQRSCHILEREMGIKLYRVEDPEDFLGFINGKLAENNPVIVPVNLRELYYSGFYQKADWIHSFLIYGHNEENKLYYIFDSTQRHDEGGYTLYKFVVQEDTLCCMHKSFSENIYKEGIYYLCSEEIPLDVDVYQYLYQCVYQFCNSRNKNPYIELDITNQLLKDKKVNQDNIKALMQLVHYKKVFFRELEGVLSLAEITPQLLNKYADVSQKLLEIWSKISGKVMYYLYKKKSEKVREEIQQAIIQEEVMLSCMNEILNQLKERKTSKVFEKEKIYFINNLDHIISKVSNKEYVFEFNTGKVYNNWFQDNAPRIILDGNIIYKKFVLKAEFILEEYIEGSNFLAGLYIKDSTGSSYIFGLNSGISMLFEHTGVNNAVLEMEECSNNTIIEIKVVEQQLFLSYIIDEKKTISATPLQIKGTVVCAGICCKTWGQAHRMCFRVKNIEINSIL